MCNPNLKESYFLKSFGFNLNVYDSIVKLIVTLYKLLLHLIIIWIIIILLEIIDNQMLYGL